MLRRARLTSRPRRPPGRSPSPEAAGAPIHVVHLSCAAALARGSGGQARGVPGPAETCPHYLTLTDERYDAPTRRGCARFVISPPLRADRDREALWAGSGRRDLDLVATDHVPDRVAVEKPRPRGVPFDRISNGAPRIETLLGDRLLGGRRRGPDHASSGSSTSWRRRRPACSGSAEGRDRGRAATPTSSCSIRPPAARIRAADLHHTSDYTPYEGLEVRGAVRSVLVRGEFVIRDGLFVGRRGYGRFIERELELPT